MRIRLIVLIALFFFTSTQCQNIAGKMQSRIQEMSEIMDLEEESVLGSSSTTKVGVPLLYQRLSLAQSKDLGEDCYQDIKRVASSLQLLSMNSSLALLSNFTRKVTLPVLDSSGKPEPGRLRGAAYYHGHYTQCTAIDYPVSDSGRNFKADFMKFYVGAANKSCTVSVDVCMPIVCRASDVEHYLHGLIESGDLSGRVCHVLGVQDSAAPYDTAYYAVLIFVSAMIVFCFIAGIVDYFFSTYVEKTRFASGLHWQLFLAFSFYRNALSVFETSSVDKPGQIGILHCMRFFSMCWVVMGHTWDYYYEFMNNRFDYVFGIEGDLTTEIINNAFFSVDTFFFLSGLLVSFIWFKNYYKNPRAMNSPTAWIMFYVHRILRLSPAYFIMVIFYTFTFHQWLNAQPSNMTLMSPTDYEVCRENWYLNLLYLHNYVNYAHYCLPQSWYLSTDMQIYLFTPIILIPLAMKPLLGLIIAFLAFAISTAANIWTVNVYHFGANLGGLGSMDPEMKHGDIEKMEELMYAAPYIRCQIYIMGMVVGWGLQRYKKIRIHPVINVAGWMVGGALMLTVLFGLHNYDDASRYPEIPWNTNTYSLPVFWRSMYTSLARPAWGLGLSWFIISCFYGYGGAINKFMSWSIWAPLGRLSYCGYLVHYPLIMYLTGLSYDGFFFTNFTEAFVTRILPYIVITFPAALIWSCCFELSFGKVEMLLLGGLRAGGAAKKKEIAEVKSEREDDEERAVKEKEEKDHIEFDSVSETKTTDTSNTDDVKKETIEYSDKL